VKHGVMIDPINEKNRFTLDGDSQSVSYPDSSGPGKDSGLLYRFHCRLRHF